MLHVQDLRVDYGTTCAVHDLSLEVGPGQVCGLLGPNGAGKTTTMRTILGLIEPTYGSIRIHGVDALEDPEEARRFIGFMPDFPPIYDDLKAWEFLEMFAASYRVPPRLRKQVVDEHLALVQLSEKRDQLAGGLSRGMRQRLMLAKTLIPAPQVLLLDEPASGLDPRGRIALRDILRAQANAGRSVLVSSHILSEMTEFCTSIAIMEKGKMVASGTIEDVARQLQHGMRLEIEVIGSAEALTSVLDQHPLCGAVERTNQIRWAVPFTGDRVQAADLLATLVGQGIRIAAFVPKGQDLESIYLKAGATEVS